MPTKHILIAVLCFSLIEISSAAAVRADSNDPNDDEIVCAEVLPCDDNGQVMPAFLDAPEKCLKEWQAECEAQYAKSVTEKCGQQNAELKKLKKQVRSLRNQLRRNKGRR